MLYKANSFSILKLLFFVTILFSNIGCATYQSIFKPDIQFVSSLTDNEQQDFNILIEAKKKKTVNTKSYYWFKAGSIYKTQGDYSGNLLHGPFIQYYKEGQLKEKGAYTNGLKNGIWRYFTNTGQLRLYEEWDKGILKKSTTSFSSNNLKKISNSVKSEKSKS